MLIEQFDTMRQWCNFTDAHTIEIVIANMKKIVTRRKLREIWFLL